MEEKKRSELGEYKSKKAEEESEGVCIWSKEVRVRRRKSSVYVYVCVCIKIKQLVHGEKRSKVMKRKGVKISREME